MSGTSGLESIRNIDYTVLLCDDVETMARFYADVLGFRLRHAVPGKWAEFQVGGSLLAMRLRTRSYDGPRTDGASVQLAFRVPPDDVDVCVEQLARRGVQPLEPVADLADFGHRVLFFADPENNVIEIYAEI